MNESELTRDELASKLRSIANACRSKEEFEREAKKAFPAVATAVAYHPSGRMHMGMAMSHYHEGTISF